MYTRELTLKKSTERIYRVDAPAVL